MKAMIFYSCDGITYPVLNGAQFAYSSIPTLKRGINRMININNLTVFYGRGKTVKVEIYGTNGNNIIATTQVQLI